MISQIKDHRNQAHIAFSKFSEINQMSSILHPLKKKINIKNSHFFNFKYYNPLANKINLKCLSETHVLFNKQKSLSLINILMHFLIEETSIQNSNKKLNKFQYVLSKIPFYKMDPLSPVTADKYRGNIYRKLSLLSLTKNVTSLHSKNLLTYHKSLYNSLISVSRYSVSKISSA